MKTILEIDEKNYIGYYDEVENFIVEIDKNIVEQQLKQQLKIDTNIEVRLV